MQYPLYLLLAALLVLFHSCKKEKALPAPEQAEQKMATFHVFASKDYSTTPSQNTTAEVRLQLQVINYRTGEQKIVWDSILAVKPLKDFPLEHQKISVVKVHPVLNSHQKLNAGISVIYRDGQIISQEAKNDEAGPGISHIVISAAL